MSDSVERALTPGRDASVFMAAWDRNRNAIVVGVRHEGKRYQVVLPVAVAQSELDTELGCVGICEPPMVGDLPTVEGLFKRARRAVKRFKRKAMRAVTRTGLKLAQRAVRAVRKRPLRTLARAAALAMPGIGGPALAAMAAASRIKRLAQQAQRDPRARAAIRQVARNVKRLPASRHPVGRLAYAAMRQLR